MIFLKVLETNTAGSPQKSGLRWTHLAISEIQKAMSELGCKASRHDIKLLLKFFGFKQRQLQKTKTFGHVANREEQFQKIEKFTVAFQNKGLPVLSLDSKNKELIGNFHREGTYFGQVSQSVYSHDFPSFAKGRVIPHGIYDLTDNKGYISLGTSHDTSEFICDNLEYYWLRFLQWEYPNADWLLMLCDSGGSNNCRHYLFKQDLYFLVQRLNLNILVAHYPTYCSKYNPIERKLFCHLHRQWQGTVLKNIQLVKELAEKTSTSKGLKVEVRINDKKYLTDRTYKLKFKQNINRYIQFDPDLPLWNYFIRSKLL